MYHTSSLYSVECVVACAVVWEVKFARPAHRIVDAVSLVSSGVLESAFR